MSDKRHDRRGTRRSPGEAGARTKQSGVPAAAGVAFGKRGEAHSASGGPRGKWPHRNPAATAEPDLAVQGSTGIGPHCEGCSSRLPTRFEQVLNSERCALTGSPALEWSGGESQAKELTPCAFQTGAAVWRRLTSTPLSPSHAFALRTPSLVTSGGKLSKWLSSDRSVSMTWS